MAWTNPTTRTTDELITASIWNTDLVNNLSFLHDSNEVVGLRNTGGGGGLGERWYYLGTLSDPTFGTTSTVTLGHMYAYPFVMGRVHTLDRLAFEVTTLGGAGAVGRAGIYQAVSDVNLYPGSLIVDGGEFTVTTTGIKSATISTALSPDVLYWAVTLWGGSSTTVARSFTAGTMAAALIGAPSTLAGVNGYALDATQTYGALPASFPAGATIMTSFRGYAVAGRFSA
jgi:hypothetical protein